jgi:citrate lyase subunit beta/citryl-CoA lyase
LGSGLRAIVFLFVYREQAMRDPDLRRSVLFVGGADAAAQAASLDASPDVLVQDLEDFTPAQLKQAARARAAALYADARARGVMPAVRINPLAASGREDLAAVVPGNPDLVFHPKAERGEDIVEVAAELDMLEARLGFPPGGIEIVPNLETALGLLNVAQIAAATLRVRSCLMATEDLAADLIAERTREAEELAFARSRFLLDCRALRIEPIDAPYTFSDAEGCEREARRSRQLGYRSKSAVVPEHVAVIHRILTPSAEDVDFARRVIAAFEAARAKGEARPLVDGLWVEPPAYRNAKRLLERATRLESAAQRGSVGREGR